MNERVHVAKNLISCLVRMSDNEEAPTSRIEKVRKPRAPMTEAQKAVLAKGRAKLAAARDAVRSRTMEIQVDPVNAIAAPKVVKKKVQRVVVEDESESEPEEIHVVRRRATKKPAKVVYDSEDEEEPEEARPAARAPTRRPSAPVARRSPAPRAAPEPEAEPPFHVHFF